MGGIAPRKCAGHSMLCPYKGCSEVKPSILPTIANVCAETAVAARVCELRVL